MLYDPEKLIISDFQFYWISKTNKHFRCFAGKIYYFTGIGYIA